MTSSREVNHFDSFRCLLLHILGVYRPPEADWFDKVEVAGTQPFVTQENVNSSK